MKCLYMDAHICWSASYLYVFSNLATMLVVVFIGGGSCEVYESLPWTPENPMFMTNKTQCVDGEFPQMYVLPESKFYVICPTPQTVLETVQSTKAKQNLFENLWIIYDKDSFETCNVNTTNAVLIKKRNRQLIQCNAPLGLKYFTIVFQPFSPVSGGLEFTPGKDYYFLATSDGTVGSLNNSAGGHCNDTKNSVSMRFKVHVCKDENDTKCWNHTLGKLDCERPPTSAPSDRASTATQQTSETVLPTEQSSITATTSLTSSLTQSSTVPPNETITAEQQISLLRRQGKEDNSTVWKTVAVTCICLLGVGMVAVAITIYIWKRDKTERRQAWPLRFVTILTCCQKNNHKQVKNKADKECPMYGHGTSNAQGNSNIAYDPDHSNDQRKEKEMADENDSPLGKDCVVAIDDTRADTDQHVYDAQPENPRDKSFLAKEMGLMAKPPRRLEPMTMANNLSGSVNGATNPYSRPLSTFGKDGISLGLAHKIV